MSRFAQYYLQYNYDFAPREWEKRQEHLGKLLEKDDSFTFRLEADSNKVHKHKVYHLRCNKNIIVMRFANDKPKDTENDFEPTKAPHEPSCFIMIDNRDNLRTIAIQKRKEAFSNPNQVANILAHQLNERLNLDYNYTLRIYPDYYPEDLFKAWEKLQQHVASMRFSSPDALSADEILQKVEVLKNQGKDYFDDSLMKPIIEMALAAKQDKYHQSVSVMPEDKKNALYLNKSSVYIKNMITLSAAIGEPVELVTNDGASFRCFVDHDADNTDKIVSRDFEPRTLELLFKPKDKDGNELTNEQIDKLEEEVVEFMNSIKHKSEDIESQAVA